MTDKVQNDVIMDITIQRGSTGGVLQYVLSAAMIDVLHSFYPPIARPQPRAMTSLIRPPKTAFNGRGAAPTPGAFLRIEAVLFVIMSRRLAHASLSCFRCPSLHSCHSGPRRRWRHHLAVRRQAQDKGAPKANAFEVRHVNKPSEFRRLSDCCDLPLCVDFKGASHKVPFPCLSFQLCVFAWVHVSMPIVIAFVCCPDCVYGRH